MLSPERVQELGELQKKLCYTFQDLSLLNKALTHKSFVNETNQELKNNERFEFLGDSVLDLMVSDYLVRTFESYGEGRLSKMRAAVVNEACLADLAKRLDLGRYLLLGRGEDLSGGREKLSLLANAYEALAGAIYRDSSLEAATRVLLPDLEKEMAKLGNSWRFHDFKSELQEHSQTQFNSVPEYRVAAEHGPDHDKRFEVEVSINNGVRGIGMGKSKKEAEQAAAREALQSLNIQPGDSLKRG